MATKVFIRSSDGIDYNTNVNAALIGDQLTELGALLKDGGGEMEFTTLSFFDRTSDSNSVFQLHVVGENGVVTSFSIMMDYEATGTELFDELKRKGRITFPGG